MFTAAVAIGAKYAAKLKKQEQSSLKLKNCSWPKKDFLGTGVLMNSEYSTDTTHKKWGSPCPYTVIGKDKEIIYAMKTYMLTYNYEKYILHPTTPSNCRKISDKGGRWHSWIKNLKDWFGTSSDDFSTLKPMWMWKVILITHVCNG